MFHSPSVQNSDVIEDRIVKSLNGLDHYSYQFWVDHVLIYLKDPHVAAQPSKLIDLLDSLLWLRGKPHVSEIKQHQSTENLFSFGNHPAALELMRQVIAFRENSRKFERDRKSPEGRVLIIYHHDLMLIRR